MSVVIEKIFLLILDMSIMASYCILAVMVLRWLFRKAPKRYSYLLWIVVAFRLVCPLSIDSTFSIFNLDLVPEAVSEALSGAEIETDQLAEAGNRDEQLTESGKQNDQLAGQENRNDQLPESANQTDQFAEQENRNEQLTGSGNQSNQQAESGNQSDQQIAAGNQSDQLAEPGDESDRLGEQENRNDQLTVSGNQDSLSGENDQMLNVGMSSQENIGQGHADASGTQKDLLNQSRIRWSLIGSWAWAGGILALAGFMMISWLRLKYQIRFAVKVKNGVYEADGIHSAFVLGVIRPKIYLPVGLTKEEQSWILLHENCHKWRKDYLIKMIASILTVIYWFNPLIWVAWSCFCRDMEMSCDEMALEGASQEMRKAYSRTLLSVASDRKVSWHLTPAFGENSVKSRIKHVLGFKKPAVWAGGVFAVVLVMMLVMFGTNGKADDTNEVNGSGETVSAESNDGTQAGDIENSEENKHTDNNGEEISTGSGLSAEYKDLIYQKQELSYDFPLGIYDMASDGEIVYLYGWEYRDTNWTSENPTETMDFAVAKCNLDGSGMKTIYTYEETFGVGYEYNRENGERILSMEVDADGNLILMMLYRKTGEKSYELAKWDQEGNVLWSVPIPEEGGGGLSMVCEGENIVVGGTGYFWMFDHDGKLKKQIPFEITSETGAAEIHVTRDDQVYVSYYDVGGYNYGPSQGLYPLDLESGAVGDDINPSWLSAYHITNILPGKVIGYDFDFVMWNEYSISGWNIGDKVCTEIVNFIDSDIDATQYFELKKILGNGIFLATFREGGLAEDIGLLTKVDPETLGDKQVITVGCFSSAELQAAVRQFNETSEAYYVKLLDYSVFGYESEAEMLRLDIETGNAPDIYWLDKSDNSLIGSFIRNGWLEDLRTWFENDPELQAEDYLINVFEAYAVDGAWYQMPTSFEINTYSAAIAEVGERAGWTIDEAQELIENSPDSQWCWASQTKNSVLTEGVQFGRFVDEANGVAYFNSEEFISLLEWANEFADVEETDTALRKTDLVWPELIRRFDDFRDIIYLDQALIGFPGGAGNGGYIDVGYGLKFSISAQSNCKDGAWEFIKYFLGDDYQTTFLEVNAYSGFPVKISALKAEGEKALSADYYSAPWVGVLTEEEVERCIEYMKSLTNADQVNYSIYDIVKEVAVNYFDGEITAEAAAEAIQRRVEEYLAQ